MATADVASDMDSIRRAVGDDALNFVGYSYGSFLGVSYANLFPDKVGAVVVDGVLDPVAWTTGVGDEAATLPFSYRLRSDAGAQATLDEFFRLCDDSPAGCAFSGDSAARYDAIADTPAPGWAGRGRRPVHRRADHVRIPGPDRGDPGTMYSSFDWPFLAVFLVDLEAAASPAALGASLQAVWESTGLAPVPPPYPNFVEGFPGVACSDSDNPDDHAFWSTAADDADADFGYFGRIWTWTSSPCAVWSGFDFDRYRRTVGRRHRQPGAGGGHPFRPRHPVRRAPRSVRDLLPNSSLLTVEGWGHTSLFLSACADAAVSDYLLTRVPPADGTVCAQDFDPFGTAAATIADRHRAGATTRTPPTSAPR